jgi:hypothetical protein
LSALSEFLKEIEKGLDTLGLKQCGNVVFTIKGTMIIIMIPVDREFMDNDHYFFKKELRIVNAIRVRYYGDGNDISNVIIMMNKYIDDHLMKAITPPYVMACRKYEGVFDIFIGLSENVL